MVIKVILSLKDSGRLLYKLSEPATETSFNDVCSAMLWDFPVCVIKLRQLTWHSAQRYTRQCFCIEIPIMLHFQFNVTGSSTRTDRPEMPWSWYSPMRRVHSHIHLGQAVNRCTLVCRKLIVGHKTIRLHINGVWTTEWSQSRTLATNNSPQFYTRPATIPT